MHDPETLREIAVQIAGEAAGLLRDNACSEKYTRTLGGETIGADVEAESYIIEALRREGVRYPIVSEESGLTEGRGDLVVLLDPLDGSKNYSNCIPWSSVSLAFYTRTGEPLAGAVAPIFYGNTLSFARGAGCYEGGRRIEALEPPSRFLYVYIEHPDAARALAEIVVALRGGFKIRSLGSAALEIAYVAIGRGHSFIDLRSKLRNIDVAAAFGMILECGGIGLTPRGRIERLNVGTVEKLGSVAFTRSPELESILQRAAWGPAQ